MFDGWKRAWREAVENFRREAGGEGGAGVPAGRIAAMRRDVRAAHAELDRVNAEVTRARAQLGEEREAEQSCRRREALARSAGDGETARIAAGFAARHAERAGVLGRKVEALEAELALLRRDVAEMEALLREAEAEADAGAKAGAVPGGGGAGGADPAGSAGATADDEFQEAAFRRMERVARERAAERRLEELKRRMR